MLPPLAMSSFGMGEVMGRAELGGEMGGEHAHLEVFEVTIL